ncbi:hypothetical protein COF37_26045 [Bacillus wiedmannii]|uniref:hypothetical protein n=1 Tax=Bacillus wiedmannii TaxID=1890302 RepID=UPI000BFDBE71|nr:hypothetical protein [Bacillus wiedmannii]PHD18273.1 hypothetical protein COF37_26045 [Bacillus wiedmannii]
MSNIYEIERELFIELDEEIKELFLSYLTRELEKDMVGRSSGGGSISYGDDGKDPLLTGDFKGDDIIKLKVSSDRVITLRFTSYWKNGVFDYIKVSSDTPKTEWYEFIRKKVDMAWSATHSKKTKKFFFRSIYNYIGSRLDGDYYIANWRVAPASPENVPKWEKVENSFYLDMEIDGINEKHAYSKYEVKCNEITAILSVVLDKGIYKPSNEWLWGSIWGDNKSDLFKVGYKDEAEVPSEMPKKDKSRSGSFTEAPRNIVKYSDYYSIKLPRGIRKLFRAYEVLDVIEKEAFLSAARMYQISISVGKNIDSVSSSYRIAALDALSKPLRQNGGNKNAIISLVKKYYPGYEEQIIRLYDSIRSAHFHQGVFRDQDIHGPKRELFNAPREVFPNISEEELHLATRAILIKWLNDKIQKDEN